MASTVAVDKVRLADSLPPELWLDIIPLAYSPDTLLNLRLTCRRLNTLIEEYEHSLTADIQRLHFPLKGTGGPLGGSTGTQLFPGLHLSSYSALNLLHSRLHTLEQLHEQWLKLVYNSPELSWLKGRWQTIHRTGLLLLYHLHDVEPLQTHECHQSTLRGIWISGGEYCAKVELLQRLPATSLACLLFKLIASVQILRVYGPEPISNRYCALDIGMRSDVELAFEELLLQYGPAYFISLLDTKDPKREWAAAVLRAEVAGMIDRQSPVDTNDDDDDDDDVMVIKPATLISCVRQALAKRVGCGINEVVTRMWEILSGTAFDEVSEDDVAGLVKGDEWVKKGMKRMGF